MCNRWLMRGLLATLLVVFALVTLPTKVTATPLSASEQCFDLPSNSTSSLAPNTSASDTLTDADVIVSKEFREAAIRIREQEQKVKRPALAEAILNDEKNKETKEQIIGWIERFEDKTNPSKTLPAHRVELLIKALGVTTHQKEELRHLAYGPQLSIYKWGTERAPPQPADNSISLTQTSTYSPTLEEIRTVTIDNLPSFRIVLRCLLDEKGWEQVELEQAMANIIYEEKDIIWNGAASPAQIEQLKTVIETISVDRLYDRMLSKNVQTTRTDIRRELTILEIEWILAAAPLEPTHWVRLRELAYEQHLTFFWGHYDNVRDEPLPSRDELSKEVANSAEQNGSSVSEPAPKDEAPQREEPQTIVNQARLANTASVVITETVVQPQDPPPLSSRPTRISTDTLELVEDAVALTAPTRIHPCCTNPQPRPPAPGSEEPGSSATIGGSVTGQPTMPTRPPHSENPQGGYYGNHMPDISSSQGGMEWFDIPLRPPFAGIANLGR